MKFNLIFISSVALIFSSCAYKVFVNRLDDSETKPKMRHCPVDVYYESTDLVRPSVVIGEFSAEPMMFNSCNDLYQSVIGMTCFTGGSAVLYTKILNEDDSECDYAEGQIMMYQHEEAIEQIPEQYQDDIESSIIVEHHISKDFKPFKSGLNIAVIGLESNYLTEDEKTLLTDKLRLELISSSYFKVIERSKMNVVLEEQGFQNSGCTSDECIVEMGKLIGVSQVLAGNVGILGESHVISLRLIEVETGELTGMIQLTSNGTVQELLTDGVPHIVYEIITE